MFALLPLALEVRAVTTGAVPWAAAQSVEARPITERRSPRRLAYIRAERGTRASFGGFGTGLYYTTRVPPAAPPNVAHQTGFALAVILVLILIAALAD
jgi:hypothetical protein